MSSFMSSVPGVRAQNDHYSRLRLGNSMGVRHSHVPSPAVGEQFGPSQFQATLYNYTLTNDDQPGTGQNTTVPTNGRSIDHGQASPLDDSTESINFSGPFEHQPRSALEDTQRAYQLLNTQHQYAGQESFEPSAYCLQSSFASQHRPLYAPAASFHTNQPFRYTDTPSPCVVSPLLGTASPAATWSSSPMKRMEEMSFGDSVGSMRDASDEEDASCDKPYARLIYDALMQAPGHRMMLREIYSWFQRHTNKPTESGSNGWQNSIRHNLSMNQAFENDKGDSTNPRGQAKKANSVWILTDGAIQNGVQSTTRYRKTGSGKKASGSKTPAPLRQRSGARGGRAARRAAKLRRHAQQQPQDRALCSRGADATDPYGLSSLQEPANDGGYLTICTPTTPINDNSLSFLKPLELQPYPGELSSFYDTDEGFLERHDRIKHELDVQPKSDPCIDEVLRLHYGSNLDLLPM